MVVLLLHVLVHESEHRTVHLLLASTRVLKSKLLLYRLSLSLLAELLHFLSRIEDLLSLLKSGVQRVLLARVAQRTDGPSVKM